MGLIGASSTPVATFPQMRRWIAIVARIPWQRNASATRWSKTSIVASELERVAQKRSRRFPNPLIATCNKAGRGAGKRRLKRALRRRRLKRKPRRALALARQPRKSSGTHREAIGRSTINVAPLPSTLSARTEPFILSSALRTSARPIPVPGYSSSRCRRWNNLKICS
jgi:hypothetical protein